MNTAPTLLLTGLVLAACASAPQPATSIEPLLGQWHLAAPVPPGARIPTLAFARDGTVDGTAGVNQFSTRIDAQALAEGRLQLRPILATKMAGAAEAMQLEADFLRALSIADRLLVGGDRLLVQQGDRPLLELRRWR